MSFWFEFFRDKRFGWRFKIANFIMDDYLRNYLASANLNLNNSIDIIDRKIETRMLRRNVEKVKNKIDDLFEM